MRRLFCIAAITVFLFAGIGCSHRTGAGSDASSLNDTVLPLGFLTDTLEMVSGQVRSGENFTTLMSSLGLPPQKSLSLLQNCDSVFDARRMRAGSEYQAYYDKKDSLLQYVVYNENLIHRVVLRCFEPYGGWNADREVERSMKWSEVTINTSLWNDMIGAGAHPELILKLSDIYAWTVDFFGLQAGDGFKALYNQLECEGKVIGVDTVYYAVFSRDTTVLQSVMYDQGDGGNPYWNEKGESMRKAFLKAPLHFSRISSGFSYHRRHPVTGQVKAHTAVDYAAPTGTPVMSIGDGTVLSVGYAGAGGNTVKIRHNSVYTTAYLHLSRYAAGLRAGQRVQQGQVIGYVGSTGTATGPHLDFRVWKNGSPINPLKMESPSAEPIRPENKPALDSARLHYIELAEELKK